MDKEFTLNAVAIPSEEGLRRALDIFEDQYRLHVNLDLIAWDNYRQDFANIAVHHLPGDVAVSGTPATSDLIAMNALRPFHTNEINMLGGEASFLPSRWRAGMRPGSRDVWAIPFIVDPYVLYYNRSLLAKAGLDEAHAFESPQQLEESVQKLSACGVDCPWFAQSDHLGMLHRASSWIWAYGGDLFTPDGKRATFHEKEALKGIRAYFRLVRFTPPSLSGEDPTALLRAGRIGAMIDNIYLLNSGDAPEIGCAPTPGGAYVGGSDLIIWYHNYNENASLELVRFLINLVSSKDLLRGSSYLPAKIDNIRALAHHPNPIARPIMQAVLTGRTFPCVPMIGLVEQRLDTALLSIQQALMADPQMDIEPLLQQRVVMSGNRINIALNSIESAS